MHDLGRLLKQQRISLSLTLAGLAARSGVSSSHLGRIERGERFPSAHILRKISKPLGFDEAELLTHGGFLSQSPAPESESSTGRLDPYVARLLSQEPIEIQRSLIGLLSILKSIARAEENWREKK